MCALSQIHTDLDEVPKAAVRALRRPPKTLKGFVLVIRKKMRGRVSKVWNSKPTITVSVYMTTSWPICAGSVILMISPASKKRVPTGEDLHTQASVDSR